MALAETAARTAKGGRSLTHTYRHSHTHTREARILLTLTLDKAIKTATAIEEANKAVETLEENNEPRIKYDDQNEDHTESDVNKISRTEGRDNRRRNTGGVHTNRGRGRQQTTTEYREKNQLRCYCCGRVNHQKRDCWHRDKTCTKCGVKGHLSRVCNALFKGN